MVCLFVLDLEDFVCFMLDEFDYNGIIIMVVLGGGFYVMFEMGCDEVCIVYVFNVDDF